MVFKASDTVPRFPNVVARLLGSSSRICQKPVLASNTENTRAFASRVKTSSICDAPDSVALDQYRV